MLSEQKNSVSKVPTCRKLGVFTVSTPDYSPLELMDKLSEIGYVIDDSEQYRKANKLDKFGWNRWVGPEPHNIQVMKVETTRQGADYLTKGLAREPFENNRRIIQGW